jgi:hypothetical protein
LWCAHVYGLYDVGTEIKSLVQEPETVTMSTKQHRNPPFRAEHLGSLLRTDALLKKRDEIAAGKASQSELEAIEDQDIKDVVKLQKELRYPAMTDGEYRRHSKNATKKK